MNRVHNERASGHGDDRVGITIGETCEMTETGTAGVGEP